MPGSIDLTHTYAAKETSMSDSTPVTAPDQEVLITRIFDAPREQVFKAWTDPEEVAAWYGPAHVEVPREKVRIDLRVGGRWEVTMVQPGGGMEFAIGYEILELVEPELIVMRSDPMPEAGMHESTIVRLELHDHGTRTRMTLSDGPLPADGRGHAEAGYSAAFDKLATHLGR
jgi:uncharacterized protein YndB with AHSA1/START domain